MEKILLSKWMVTLLTCLHNSDIWSRMRPLSGSRVTVAVEIPYAIQDLFPGNFQSDFSGLELSLFVDHLRIRGGVHHLVVVADEMGGLSGVGHHASQHRRRGPWGVGILRSPEEHRHQLTWRVVREDFWKEPAVSKGLGRHCCCWKTRQWITYCLFYHPIC